MNKENRNLTMTEYGIAGALSGIFTRFTCQPLDVIKIRFQLQVSHRNNSKYKSILQTIIRISKEEGISSLWKGHIPAQALSAIYGATQFATYEQFTRNSQKNTGAHFIGGALSGGVAVVSSYPFDVIRTRLVAQGEPKVYSGMIDGAVKIYKAEGPPAFFRGMSPALMSTVPLSALIFGFNHTLTSLLLAFTGEKHITGTIACGAVAGLIGKTVVYPMDVLKKRIQATGMPEGSSSVPLLRVTGLLSAVRSTWRTEGFVGFYKGFTPSLVKAAVTNSIYLTSYDKFVNIMILFKSRAQL